MREPFGKFKRKNGKGSDRERVRWRADCCAASVYVTPKTTI